jgi:hypothetical protein
VEAGDYDNSIFLNLKEYSVGEAPDPRATAVTIDDRELQWMFRYRFNRGFDREREALPKFRAYVVLP